MKFVFRINGNINFHFFVGVNNLSEASMLLVPHGWPEWYQDVSKISCFCFLCNRGNEEAR